MCHFVEFMNQNGRFRTVFEVQKGSCEESSNANFQSVEITEIYFHTFLTKISWKQRLYTAVYTIEVTKELISWYIFSVRVNFSSFHTVIMFLLLKRCPCRFDFRALLSIFQSEHHYKEDEISSNGDGDLGSWVNLHDDVLSVKRYIYTVWKLRKLTHHFSPACKNYIKSMIALNYTVACFHETFFKWE